MRTPRVRTPRLLIKLCALVASTIALGAPDSAHSTEGGGGRALGVDTILAGVTPPPGLMLKALVADYQAARTLDGSGNGRAGISNFDLHAKAVGIHIQYVWPDVELWNAKIETSIASPYVDSRVAFDVSTPTGTVRRQDSVTGGGDTLFGPLILGWHGERFHQRAGLQFTLPTGSFSPSKLANPGRGYLAVVPNYAFTWFPTSATEVSLGAYYFYNRRNPDTSYRSGREIAIDYGLGYDATPAVQIGASGYLYKQVTDDTQNGQAVPGGNRGQALAIGPFLRYHGKGWAITLKWQHETSVENRATGDRLLLQIGLKLR